MTTIEKLIPLKIEKEKNLIICQRQINLRDISRRLDDDVRHKANVNAVNANDMYAMREINTIHWSRAIVKFNRRDNNVPVLQKLDGPGLVDFDPEKIDVRIITNDLIKNLKCGQIKMFVYAVMPYKADEEFMCIFNNMLKNQTVTAVYRLIEQKQNITHECYAGDFLCEFREKLLSFREVLLQQEITFPSRVIDEINKEILQARTEIFAQKRALQMPTILSIQPEEIQEGGAHPAYVIGQYNVFEVVGEGSFGLVVRGVDTINKNNVAIKIFKSDLFGNEDRTKDQMKELKFAQMMKHVSIVQLLNVVQEASSQYLVFDFYENNLVDEIYKESYEYSRDRAKSVCEMLLRGVQYMHNQNVMHRDLKPSNILVGSSGQVKICDFGLATEILEMSEYSGTKGYMAPETHLRFGYTEKIDIWAIGCIIAEMWLKAVFLSSENPLDHALDSIWKIFGTPTFEKWPDFYFRKAHITLVRRYDDKLSEIIKDDELNSMLYTLMALDPKQRPSALKALEHPFFKKISAP